MSKSKLSDYGSKEPWSNYAIVVRHPLADQVDLLENLGVDKSACIVCDCWWEVLEHLVLVSVVSESISKTTFFSQDEALGQRFYVRTTVPQITTETINSVLFKISLWIKANRERFLNPPDTPTTIYEQDIGRPLAATNEEDELKP